MKNYLIGITLTIIISSWFIISYRTYIASSHLENVGLSTIGTIVKKYPESTIDGSTWVFEVSFIVEQDSLIAKNRYGTSWDENKYVIGQKIEILYDPNDTANCRFNNEYDVEHSSYKTPLIIGFVIISVFSICLVLVKKKILFFEEVKD